MDVAAERVMLCSLGERDKVWTLLPVGKAVRVKPFLTFVASAGDDLDHHPRDSGLLQEEVHVLRQAGGKK